MDKKQMGVAEVVGGMALLLAGKKLTGLSVFSKGLYDLESQYKEDHPELEPGFESRWQNSVDFYDSTHQEPTNRLLHMWGIPLIVGGAIGLFGSKPYKKPWLIAAGTFAFGWALNIAGHAWYEKNKPAFTDDPLSFVAGPIWDLKQVVTNGKK